MPTYSTSYFLELMKKRPFWSTLDMAAEAGCHKDTVIKYLERLEFHESVKRYKVKTGGIAGFIYIWVLMEKSKMFTDENTTGFTKEQLEKMNEELEETLDGYRFEDLLPGEQDELIKRESWAILKKYS